jgi:hypothetical protein
MIEQEKEPLSWELAWLACCYQVKGDARRAGKAADRYCASVRTSDLRYEANTRPFLHETDLHRLWK